MLRISNHTACRFAEKARFFRSFGAGRRCAAASRFTFFKGETLYKKDFVLLGTEKPAGLAGFSVPYDQDLGESEEFVCAAGGRLPGNRRRYTRIAASSRKKRVGEGWGDRGEGKSLRAR